MRKVIVFRHGPSEDLGKTASWQFEAHLTEEGKALIRKIALSNRGFLEKCSNFRTSPFIRAQESLYEMMKVLGLGKDIEKVEFEKYLWTSFPKEWIHYESLDFSLKEIWEKYPGFIKKEGGCFFSGLKDILFYLSEKEQALCFSHGGPMDAVLISLKNTFKGDKIDININPFSGVKKGEGIIFTFNKYKSLQKVEKIPI